MPSLAVALAVVVAALHVGFFVLEAVLWTQPTGRRIFKQTVESAAATKVLALNQGCYNLGLAAMIVWAALGGHAGATQVLLIYVVAMGLVGGITAKPTILMFQAAPAVAALIALHV